MHVLCIYSSLVALRPEARTHRAMNVKKRAKTGGGIKCARNAHSHSVRPDIMSARKARRGKTGIG
eukprot:12278285-Alexandrium_andersonii.AAC.1